MHYRIHRQGHAVTLPVGDVEWDAGTHPVQSQLPSKVRANTDPTTFPNTATDPREVGGVMP